MTGRGNINKPLWCAAYSKYVSACVYLVSFKCSIVGIFVGLTENTFKTRFNNHKASFNSYQKRNSTELSKYVWDLKRENVDYSIRWKILKRAKSYNCASNRCNLCLWEKYYIICKPELATLNKRNELVSSCRHARKFLLLNI